MKSSEKFSDNHEITLWNVKKDFEPWLQKKSIHRISEYFQDMVLFFYIHESIEIVENHLRLIRFGGLVGVLS